MIHPSIRCCRPNGLTLLESLTCLAVCLLLLIVVVPVGLVHLGLKSPPAGAATSDDANRAILERLRGKPKDNGLDKPLKPGGDQSGKPDDLKKDGEDKSGKPDDTPVVDKKPAKPDGSKAR